MLAPVGAASLLQITIYYCNLVSGTVWLGILTDGGINVLLGLPNITQLICRLGNECVRDEHYVV